MEYGINCGNTELYGANELWNNLEALGTESLFGTREDYLKDVKEWSKRDIPKKDEAQMRKDTKAYLDYCIDCLSGKHKFDLEKAQRLHRKITRFKPENYNLKENLR